MISVFDVSSFLAVASGSAILDVTELTVVASAHHDNKSTAANDHAHS